MMIRSLISLAAFVLILSGCQSYPGNTAVPLADGLIPSDAHYDKVVHYGATRPDLCQDRGCSRSQMLRRLDSGNERSEDAVSYGQVVVEIPYVKKVGGTDGISVVDLIHGIAWADFRENFDDDDLLVFVHGFRTSFTDAAKRAAQIGHDTNFEGEVVLYSWASGTNAFAYGDDKARAKENFGPLSDFLFDLANDSEQRDIHIIAHSMGTYLLMHALAALDERLKSDPDLLAARKKLNGQKVFGQIILAAPDISDGQYREKFTGIRVDQLADRVTLYSSLNDYVLRASKYVNYIFEGTSEPRVGDSSGRFAVVSGVDNVDARQEIKAQFFGHSFFANYRSLVTDIHLLLRYGAKPNERMLQSVLDEDLNRIWFIRD